MDQFNLPRTENRATIENLLSINLYQCNHFLHDVPSSVFNETLSYAKRVSRPLSNVSKQIEVLRSVLKERKRSNLNYYKKFIVEIVVIMNKNAYMICHFIIFCNYISVILLFSIKRITLYGVISAFVSLSYK